MHVLLLIASLAISGTSWWKDCNELINNQLSTTNIQTSDLVDEIVFGIERASQDIEQAKTIKITDTEKLQFCEYAATTAEVESRYTHLYGRHGELGIYQFKPGTALQALKQYNQFQDYNQKNIRKALLNTGESTRIFILHFYDLIQETQHLRKTWTLYNNGSKKKIYASKVMAAYARIRLVFGR